VLFEPTNGFDIRDYSVSHLHPSPLTTQPRCLFAGIIWGIINHH
jgi:hypothetical protein